MPSRTPTAGFRYQRDEEVRQFVIKQAKGACEYCRELGFLLSDGRYYLEAHHIIALAKQGPDTVDNVIALCPSDHREAHYGKRAIVMENEMIEIIKNRKV
jgi:5-methylcytosine-specific restriction protein A